MDCFCYMLQVASNSESDVSEQIRDALSRKGLSDCLCDILIPTEEVFEVKRGIKKISKRKLYPGYVFLNLKCMVTDDIRQVVSNIPKSVKFLGGDRAMPISQVEAERVIRQAREGVERPRSSVIFEVGEEVDVTEGPFANFKGRVEEVDCERSRLKVCVSIFRRDTSVELDFFHVSKRSS